MSDGLRVLVWSAVFAGGLGACLWLAARGLPRTYVRDVLHVGAGVWPLGWKTTLVTQIASMSRR